MTKFMILTMELRNERDVVSARTRAREIAREVGFDHHDQTRVATALSEVARNAFQHAGSGRVQFSIETSQPPSLRFEVSDHGPGIHNLEDVLEGSQRADARSRIGLSGARKLVDGLHIECPTEGGTRVELTKRLPKHVSVITPQLVSRIGDVLTRSRAESPLEEMRTQNHELLQALEQLKKSQADLMLVNGELAETNRGVISLYAELEEKAEALRRSAELKARFFSEMNHEVRTPINAILSLSEILLNGTLGSPARAQERPLELIRKSAQQLSELVNDLLDLAKSEAGKMTVRSESFTVTELFAGLRGMFRPVHTKEQVALVFDAPKGLPPLETDEGKVSQILRNFVSNALKFTERGSVRVSAELDGDDMRFAVSDTGVGIDPSQRDRLFEPFTQLDNPRQKRFRGTGLGLSLSRNLAELLGGSIHVESELGVGSVFELVVPRTYSGAESGDQRAARRRSDAPASTRGRVLIIDDDEVARYLLRRTLDEAACDIIEAATGRDGIAHARKASPEVIFLDLAIPEMNGFEVLDALAGDPATSSIPVVINTGTPLESLQRANLAGRTVDILNKDFVGREGSMRVRSALDKVGLSRFSAHVGE